jgi:ketosteroid isomerase-like protein
MAPSTHVLALPVLLLASCHPAPQVQPAPEGAEARVVRTFLQAYGRRDLEGMMACLADEATFVGTGSVLSKAQIRDFFQASFQKHPKLRVEVGELTVLPGRVQVRVRVETEVVWADTWIFEVRDRRIRSYRLAAGRH